MSNAYLDHFMKTTVIIWVVFFATWLIFSFALFEPLIIPNWIYRFMLAFNVVVGVASGIQGYYTK